MGPTDFVWFFSRRRYPLTVNCAISSLKTVSILVCHINLMVSEYEEDNVKVINQGQYQTIKVKVVKRHSIACSLQEFEKW